MIEEIKPPRGYGKNDPQKSIRFSQEQYDALVLLARDFPVELRSFTDALRAVVCRDPLIPKDRLKAVSDLFRRER